MDRGLDRRGPEVAIKTPYSIILAALPLLFLGAFFFYPLASILLQGLMQDGHWDLSGPARLFSHRAYAGVIWFTTWQAALSTVLTLIIALPAAYVFARYRFAGRNLLLSLTAIPFVLPSVVVASAFQALLGSRGLVNAWLMDSFSLTRAPIALDHTIWFILMAHVFYNFTVIVRIVGSSWARLQPEISQAARMLGATPLRCFREVTLPLIMPSVLAASMLVFIFCFSSFGVILLLGGPRFSTIEVEIYRQAVHLFNLPMASALSLLQILLTLAFMGTYTALQRRTTVTLYPESRAVTERRVSTPRDMLIVGATCLFVLMLLGSPLAALLARSFQGPGGLTLDYYRNLSVNIGQSLFFIPPLKAMGYSLGFALSTLVMALAVGLPAAFTLSRASGPLGAVLDPILMLPLACSAVTLGFGFIIALDEPPLNLRTSVWLIPLAHTLVAYPFVVRSVLPSLKGIPNALKEAASMLGASPAMVFLKVVAPIVSRAVVVGAIFAFTISIGEFGATVFIARPDTPTMPLAIYRFLGQPGDLNYGQAMA
ncbi:MAG TPA: iron ABC transporter permease, partial [Deltaproteobacteria bacterium]|nr:iron ABC transporter permease [Deltaproteobacteria bacterium]